MPMMLALALALAVAPAAQCDSPKAPAAARVAACFRRAQARFAQGQMDGAIADLTTIIDLQPDNAGALLDRGAVYDAIGRPDLSIPDYDRAVALDPSHPQAIDNRGNAYAMQGDYDKALADHTKAIDIDQTYYSAYRDRALTYFLMGRYDLASTDAEHFVALVPQDGYAQLWVQVAHHRAGGSPVPAASASPASLVATWPAPLLDLYNGIATPEQALAAAANPAQRCEAAFYVAEWRLSAGDPNAARDGLTAAVDTCPHGFVEYVAAKVELGRLPVGSPSPSP